MGTPTGDEPTLIADPVRLLETEVYDIVDEVEPLYAACSAEYVAVRMWLTEAENAQVTDEDIAAAASVFIGRPNPRMVANRIAILHQLPRHSDGPGCADG